MFNAPIDYFHHDFEYSVTVAGNYHYVCHPATPHGEDAYMVVSDVTAVPVLAASHFSSVAEPNPFSGKITIETSEADLILFCNVLGEKVKSLELANGQTKVDADMSSLPVGIFFYSVIRNGVVIETRKIIKQ